jgi:condensin-2 complex subunit G2
MNDFDRLFSDNTNSDDLISILQNAPNLVDLKEKLEEVSNEDLHKFWRRLNTAMKNTTIQDQEFASGTLDLIRSIVSICSLFIVRPNEPSVYFLDGLRCLVRLTDSKNFNDDGLKNSIFILAETAYLSNWANSVHMVPDILTYLFVESLKQGSKDSILKRLLAVSRGMDELDLTTSGESFNRDLLLRCFVHPSFLRLAEGHKILAVIAVASDGYLLDQVCKIIKAQIFNGTRTLSTVYGEIFSRMWKDGCRETRSKIEERIQDFLFLATLTTHPKYFKGLRHLLRAFHDVKRTEDFENTLVKIFEPILWRSLQCANSLVRVQAAMLYFDVFPLQKIGCSSEQSDLYLQKQFDQLTGLLKDPDYRVRSTSIIGTCHIIRQYWDMLPFSTISNLLKFVFDTLSHDVSHNSVRLAVLSGLEEIILQPLSHLTMKTLLPILKNLLHDKSEKVRLAFVRLLIQVSLLKRKVFTYFIFSPFFSQIKDVREISLFEIVSITDLTDRLLLDSTHPQIVLGICELLVSTYYPNTSEANNESSRQLQRCVQLIEDNFLAAEIFYGNLKNFISLGSVVKLTVILFQLLKANLSRFQTTSVKPTKNHENRKRSRKHQLESQNVISPVLFFVSLFSYVLRLKPKFPCLTKNYFLG